LVFELLGSSLLDVIRKYGNSGLASKAVQVYARKLFLSLAFLKKLDYVHADLKPSNILISEKKTVLKLADFGSAVAVQKEGNQPVSEDLVTGWYRPPEIILGMHYGTPVDMWSAACTIFECATGKLLFKAGTNNELLFRHLQVGSISRKLLKKAFFKDTHFDENCDFVLQKADPITGRKYRQSVTLIPQRDLLAELLGTSTGEDRKTLIQLHDLLKKILVLDPSKRLTPEEALQHPFLNTV
jgi:serine/threonine-protein kinase PRP4